MLIDARTCEGCGECVPYCPMAAISLRTMGPDVRGEIDTGEEPGTVAHIDRDECVECWACQRADVCPTDSFRDDELEWPRILRRAFSDPLFIHGATGVPGRGTEEVKTNDVTGLYRSGFLGVGLEFGRPGVGARFRDVEKATMMMARLGIPLAADNPLVELLETPVTGRIRADVRDEKVLSVILQCVVPGKRVPELVEALHELAGEIDTVFSVDFICRAEEDGRLPMLEELASAGLTLSPNGKVNVGLGRPLLVDETERVAP